MRIIKMNLDDVKVAVVGLGYVGLPLAVALGNKYRTIGYDINSERVDELRNFSDKTMEVTFEELSSCPDLSFSSNLEDLDLCNVFIVTVPTPINEANSPDLSYLEKASEAIGKALKPGHIVIYESTVYPGATEEVCVPILEKVSKLEFNKDFFVGYSPERINPGDRERNVTDILKVTSGSTLEAAIFVDKLYSSVIRAGTHMASSIKVAEAAKVIENTQRDLNIALVNELAMIFEKIGIDTSEVISAAATKWNFIPYQPGMVGGHCIGVDPYYLTHKAMMLGHHPEVILAGRRINENMSKFIAEKFVKQMIQRGALSKDSRVLIVGCTFKENCPDIRNSKVFDLLKHLEEFGLKVDLFDPLACAEEVRMEYGHELVDRENLIEKYSGIVLAVPHKELTLDSEFLFTLLGQNAFVLDVKAALLNKTNVVRL